MLKLHLSTAAAIATVALLLAGCGGGGNGTDPANARTTGSQVPASAQQSVAGLIAFLQELVAQSSDTTEPVLLGDAVLPTDDSSEPAAVH